MEERRARECKRKSNVLWQRNMGGLQRIEVEDEISTRWLTVLASTCVLERKRQACTETEREREQPEKRARKQTKN